MSSFRVTESGIYMYLIGEFSKIAQVSGRQLRHYDKLGLLTPEYSDPQTGYRYYSAKQLPRLNRIIALKELGMSLDQIKRMLDEEISPDELRGMLMMKKAQAEQTLQAEIARVRYIESRIAQINVEGNMEDYDIVLKSVPAKPFLAVRRTVTLPEGIQLAQQVYKSLPARTNRKLQGQFTAISYSDVLPEKEFDIAFGFQLDTEVDDDYAVELGNGAALTISELPAEATMLTVTRVGHPRLSHGSLAALGVWAEANGYEFTGHMREVFINFTPPNKMDERVTEVQYPVRPKDSVFPQLT